MSLVSLTSGPPWNLECIVEEMGRDLICCIRGGTWHIGAVALSEWNGHQVQTRLLVVRGHKEGPISQHAAARLCSASRQSVTCIAGIHFDSLTYEQIVEISAAAAELANRAAERLGKPEGRISSKPAACAGHSEESPGGGDH